MGLSVLWVGCDARVARLVTAVRGPVPVRYPKRNLNRSLTDCFAGYHPHGPHLGQRPVATVDIESCGKPNINRCIVRTHCTTNVRVMMRTSLCSRLDSSGYCSILSLEQVEPAPGKAHEGATSVGSYLLLCEAVMLTEGLVLRARAHCLGTML